MYANFFRMDLYFALIGFSGMKIRIHGIRELCERTGINEGAVRPLIELLGLYGEPDEIIPKLGDILKGTPAEAEVAEIAEVMKPLSENRHIMMDFSIAGDTNYYNGIAFEGYIDGVPECVLVGGRYDRLMQRMKKKSRAIGFAVYMDTLAMLRR